MTTALRVIEPDEPTQRIERITAAAREVPFGRTMLLWIAAILYGLGYGVATIFGMIWLALVWVAMAVRLGWTEARVSRSTSSSADATA